MVWYVIFTLIAVIAIFVSGLLYEKGNQGWAAVILILSSVIVFSAEIETLRKTRFDGYTSITPEPAVYNVIFTHELGEDEILVGVHPSDSSYRRVFQLEKDWFLDKNIPSTPKHLIVSEGDEEQLVLVLR